MSLLARPTLRISLLALTLSLGACADGDDDGPAPAPNTGVFAGQDDPHLHRAAFAAVGGDVFYLGFGAALYAGDASATCPAVTTAGGVTTVTGGCVTDAGAHLAGRLTLTNVEGVAGGPAYDRSKPSIIEAEGWQDDGGDGLAAIDGTFTLTRTATGESRVARLDSTALGIRAQLDVTYDCAADGMCTIAAGSQLQVDGIGATAMAGSFRFDEPLVGSITLAGTDQMVIDVATSAERCFRVAVAGAAPHDACALR